MPFDQIRAEKIAQLTAEAAEIEAQYDRVEGMGSQGGRDQVLLRQLAATNEEIARLTRLQEEA